MKFVKRSHRAVSAATTYPNTPESDKEPKVWHTVTVEFQDGSVRKYLHYSQAPDTAIREVNEMETDYVFNHLEHEGSG